MKTSSQIERASERSPVETSLHPDLPKNQTGHLLAPGGNRGLIGRSLRPALCGLLLALLAAPAWADDDKPKKTKTIPFTDARIRIEVNATDQDSGLHAMIDAEGWRWVKIYDPRGRVVFHVMGGGSVRKTGLTELFFESAEPGFEDLPLNEFLRRFPAGEYRFVGQTINGDKLFSTAVLTHALPNGPVLLSPADGSVQDPNNTVVVWEPVADPPCSRIARYEVLVTQENPKPKRVLSAVVPGTVSHMIIPPTFLQRDTEYKYEVLAIEEGGNQTLSEGTFRTAP